MPKTIDLTDTQEARAKAALRLARQKARFHDDESGWLHRATAIAARCGISREAVYQWEVVPEGRVEAVAEVSEVPCVELRPDLYGPGACDEPR